MAKCLNCGAEIRQKGNRKRLYCDDKCRMAFSRTARLKPNSQSEQIQSEQSNPGHNVVTPEGVVGEVPANFGQPDCACLHCQANRKTGGKFIINHGPRKTFDQLGDNELNRVSLPGDVDYVGVATDILLGVRARG